MDIHNRADDEDNSDDAENDSLVVFPDIGQFLFKIHFRQLLFFELHLLLPCHVGFITTCHVCFFSFVVFPPTSYKSV